MKMTTTLLTDSQDIMTFLTAGKSVVTLKSVTTGKHYTYKITPGKGAASHFVSLLTGSSNQSDYTYLGSLFETPRGLELRLTRKSTYSKGSKPFRALEWTLQRLASGWDLSSLEVHHQNRCGRCARPLTTPESCSRGLGPVCATR